MASYVFVNGIHVGIAHTGSLDYDRQEIMINAGVFYNEFSDWAVMELMTWAEMLSKDQMKIVSVYLLKKVELNECEHGTHVSRAASAGVSKALQLNM